MPLTTPHRTDRKAAMPKTKTTMDTLKPRKVNPRTMTDEDRARLGKTLREFGDLGGVVKNVRSGELVGGHQRVTEFRKDIAAEVVVEQRLKKPDATGSVAFGYVMTCGTRYAYREVDWDAPKEAAANLAANRVHGDFDLASVGEMLKEFDAGFDFDLTGFDGVEIAEMLGGETSDVDAEPKIDQSEELRKKYGVKKGQVWGLGAHRVLCGDSRLAETFKQIAGDGVDMSVTSPPYNQKIDGFKPSGMHRQRNGKGWVDKVARLAYSDSLPEEEYQASQRKLLSNCFDVMKSSGGLFYNHKNRYREKVVVSPMNWIPGPFKLRQEIIWSRHGSVTQNARMFLPSDERIFWMYKGDDFFFDDSTEIKSWSTVWDLHMESNLTHAVAFPIELPKRCIIAASRKGDIVLEPYLGSGTTLIACEQTGRRCRAIELDPGYVAVTIQRWVDATKGEPKLL